MAKNLSAIKRVQLASRNNLRNRSYKSSIKTIMKKVAFEIDNFRPENSDQVNLSIAQAYSKIDKAVKKGVIPKNSAARKKSILIRKLKNAKKSEEIL